MAQDRRGQRPSGEGQPSSRGGTGAAGSRGGQGGSRGSSAGARGGQGGGSRYQKSSDERRGGKFEGRGEDRRGGGQGGASRYGKSSDERRSGGQGGGSRYGKSSDDRRGGKFESRGESGPRGGRKYGDDDRRGGKPGDDRRTGGSRQGRDGGYGGGRRQAPPATGRGFRRDDSEPRTAEQAVYDGPDLPDHITGRELDRNVAAQLKGLPEKLAARVAKHLAAAQELIESDPETAYRHTLAARARASRLAIVREATGEAAYASGHYAEALSELRAAKRMNGATDYLPIMADCHRAIGQPEQALKLAKSPSVANFIPEAKAEMTIVEAGARRDMGQLDAALRTLELAPLMSKSREAWVVRLRYAYADTLQAAGREADALAWFHRTHAIDADELTDAAERADALERQRD